MWKSPFTHIQNFSLLAKFQFPQHINIKFTDTDLCFLFVAIFSLLCKKVVRLFQLPCLEKCLLGKATEGVGMEHEENVWIVSLGGQTLNAGVSSLTSDFSGSKETTCISTRGISMVVRGRYWSAQTLPDLGWGRGAHGDWEWISYKLNG